MGFLAGFFNNLFSELFVEIVGENIVGKFIEFIKKKHTECKQCNDILQKVENYFSNCADSYKDLALQFKAVFVEISKSNKAITIHDEHLIDIAKEMTEKKKNKIAKKDFIKFCQEIIITKSTKDFLENNSETFNGWIHKEENKANLFMDVIGFIQESVMLNELEHADSQIRMLMLMMFSLHNKISVMNKNIFPIEETDNGETYEIDSKDVEIGIKTCVDSDGQLQLNLIKNSTFPNYILNECPECGYYGDRLHIDDNSKKIVCGACGHSFSLAEYDSSEITEIHKKIDLLLANVALKEDIQKINDEDRVKLLNEIKEIMKNTVDNEYLQHYLNEQQEDFKEQIKDNQTYLTNIFNNIMKQFADNISEDTKEIKVKLEEISGGLEEKIEKFIVQNNENLEIFKEQLNTVKIQNEAMEKHLVQGLENISNQISQLSNYVTNKFSSFESNQDELLRLVRKMFTKEYASELTNNLANNLKGFIQEAIDLKMSNLSGGLSSVGMSNILTELSNLHKEMESVDIKNQQNNEEIKYILKKRGDELSAQINSLSKILEESDVRYMEKFQAIIKSQDDIKKILLGTVALKLDYSEMQKMYQGKIPSDLLYNEGFGGEFACPYCGAVEERKFNDEYYCKCSACGNKFLAVDYRKLNDKENIKKLEQCGKSKEDCVYEADGKEWRKKFTANTDELDVGKYKILPKGETEEYKSICIIPKDLSKNDKNEMPECNFDRSYWFNLKVLIFEDDRLKSFKNEEKFFNNLVSLEKIVFMPHEYEDSNNEYKYFFQSNKIYVPNENVKIYGKTEDDNPIMVIKKTNERNK